MYGDLYAGVDSRVDSNTFMGNPMPESTLSLCQSRLSPPVRDFGFSLCSGENRGTGTDLSVQGPLKGLLKFLLIKLNFFTILAYSLSAQSSSENSR